jgi:MoxR-like ATPase
VLLQGPPGLGKTLLARAFCAALGGRFQRVQGTADLMPTDIAGVHVFDAQRQQFSFRPGPLFADVLLFDELNRAGPRTQSALLEAMQERQVTTERETLPLAPDFLVVATQNPRDYEGTFPLPESQLDRFLLRVDVDYPERATEATIIGRHGAQFARDAPAASATAVVDPALLGAARREAADVHLSDAVSGYVLDLAAASRGQRSIALGLSTRGVLAVVAAARVAAALRGSDFVSADDVKRVAAWTIAHRLLPTPDAIVEGWSDTGAVASLLTQVAVPR